MKRGLTLAALVLCAGPALAAGGGHGDPIAEVVLSLAIVLVTAKIGGDIAVRLGQPAVLGELVLGVILGNLALIGVPALDPMKTDPSLDMVARLGVLILLFEVGLESTVPQMLKVGGSAIVVATIGVLAPFALGWVCGMLLLPDASPYVHAFLGATLCATSVGITARVLQDLGRGDSREARVILGAAVVDDVMGLIVLAVVSGAITAAETGGSLSLGEVAILIGKSAAFLVGSLALGVYLSPKMFYLASRLQSHGVLLAIGLGFCFFLSWLADRVGLAPIVGAFAAGLIFEDVHYRDFTGRGEHPLEELVKPISTMLTPVFFVLMGMRTDLRVFTDVAVLGLAGALTAAAIVGKQLCGLGALGNGYDRVSIGIGMIPRGEVGLIFANVGLTLSIGGKPILDARTFSAIVLMVITTTLVTPPALKWSFARSSRRRESKAA